MKGTRQLDNREATHDIDQDVEQAKQIYLDKRAEGLTRFKATKATADKLNCNYTLINTWRKMFKWEKPSRKMRDTANSDKYYHAYPSGNSEYY